MGEERNLRRGDRLSTSHHLLGAPSCAVSKCFAPIRVDEQDGENTITHPSFEFQLARGQEYNTQWIFNVLKIRKGHNYTIHVALSAVACKCVLKV